MSDHWPFDQDPNAAAITTRQVLREGRPILSVIHYSDDRSWAFVCGSTNNVHDGLVVGMSCIVDLDPTLMTIADLPPGWRALREAVGAPWKRHENEEV